MGPLFIILSRAPQKSGTALEIILDGHTLLLCIIVLVH
jgi:hypothetical protein